MIQKFFIKCILYVKYLYLDSTSLIMFIEIWIRIDIRSLFILYKILIPKTVEHLVCRNIFTVCNVIFALLLDKNYKKKRAYLTPL